MLVVCWLCKFRFLNKCSISLNDCKVGIKIKFSYVLVTSSNCSFDSCRVDTPSLMWHLEDCLCCDGIVWEGVLLLLFYIRFFFFHWFGGFALRDEYQDRYPSLVVASRRFCALFECAVKIIGVVLCKRKTKPTAATRFRSTPFVEQVILCIARWHVCLASLPVRWIRFISFFIGLCLRR